MGDWSYQSALGFELRLDRLRDLFGGAVALLLVAPVPLGQVIVGALQSALRGEPSIRSMNLGRSGSVTSSRSSSALICEGISCQ